MGLSGREGPCSGREVLLMGERDLFLARRACCCGERRRGNRLEGREGGEGKGREGKRRE